MGRNKTGLTDNTKKRLLLGAGAIFKNFVVGVDTYETSIEPYEDCCTVFTPKHPRTKPKLEIVEKAEALGEFDELIERALQNLKITYINTK